MRELILTLAERGGESLAAPATARLVQVLFDELPRQPQEQLQLPVSNHPQSPLAQGLPARRILSHHRHHLTNFRVV